MTKRKILVVLANPRSTDSIEVDQIDNDVELRTLEERVRLSKKRPFETIGKFATRITDFQLALDEEEPEIVHVSSHGAKEGLLLVADDDNVPQLVSPTALANLLGAHAPALRVVVLNACYSSVHEELLESFPVRYLVSMSAEIHDLAAIRFTTGFYDALCAGKSVEFAFEEGKRSIDLANLPGKDIPRLRVNHAVAEPSQPPADQEEDGLLPPARFRLLWMLVALVLVLGGALGKWGYDHYSGSPVLRFSGVTRNGQRMKFTVVNHSHGTIAVENFRVTNVATSLKPYLEFGKLSGLERPTLQAGEHTSIEVSIERLIRKDSVPDSLNGARIRIEAEASDVDTKAEYPLFVDVTYGDLEPFIMARGSEPDVTNANP